MDKKIIEKLNNKEFARKIINFETKEDVKKAFADEGIEVTEKDIDVLGEMIVNMISRISEMPEDELKKVSGGNLTEALFYLPDKAYDFLGEHTSLPDGVKMDLVGLPILAAEFIGVWEGGKWLYKKGKNSWLPKLKEKFSKKKD